LHYAKAYDNYALLFDIVIFEFRDCGARKLTFGPQGSANPDWA
jgi:hypothetical protein